MRLGYVVAMETESPLPDCSRCKELEKPLIVGESLEFEGWTKLVDVAMTNGLEKTPTFDLLGKGKKLSWLRFRKCTLAL